MEHLSDFKPLGRLVLPELGVLECSGLVVLVGPNSSGKSQWAWANAAAERILKLGRQSGDIWAFMSDVGRFLRGVRAKP
jgi:hypothetical protein